MAYAGYAQYGGQYAQAPTYQAAAPVQYAQAAPAQYLGAAAGQYARAPAYQAAAAPVQYAQAAPAQYLGAAAGQYARAPAYQAAAASVQYAQAAPVQYAQAAPAQYLGAAAGQYAQASVYQAAAAPVQYAQAGQALYAQAPVYAAAAPATNNAATNEKIKKILAGAGSGKFRDACKPFFDQAALGRERLDYASAVRFFEAASVALVGVPMGRQHLTEIEFMRFDFDGDQSLSLKEVAKCLRHNLVELQKTIGFAHEIPVPQKTPEQAGYTVEKILASGGQGSTALAKCRDGKSVALKIYDKANANAGGIEDLRGEMEVMKGLEKSPHIMECIEIFQDQGHFYCVNELMPGGDLAALRDKATAAGVALTEAYFKGIFTQCVAALAFMHKKAMMHCDIKEPNIMVKNKDHSKPQIALIDFGLTKSSAGDGQSGCTPGYAPPEWFDLQTWLPRGDIFAMGVVFYQVLADKTPDEKKQKAGLFTEGCMSMPMVEQAVKTRQPDFRLIQGQYPGVSSFLPSMLEKNFRMRPRGPNLMALPWFR